MKDEQVKKLALKAADICLIKLMKKGLVLSDLKTRRAVLPIIAYIIHEAKIEVLREALIEIDKWDADNSQQEAIKSVARMIVKLRDGMEIAGIDKIADKKC